MQRGSNIIMPGQAMPLLQAIETARKILRTRSWRHDPFARRFLMGMAEIFPDDGLNVVLGQWPKNDTRLSTTYLRLFTSQSATTVITAGQHLADITETTFGGYAAQSLAAANWVATSATTGGRKTSYPQVSYAAVTSGSATINGFYLTDGASATVVIAQANFDDGAAVPLNVNDIIKVTPAVAFLN